MDHFNTTNSRISRTFQTTNPLLNLILAASIFTKLTQGKYIHGHTPWLHFRPIVGYYPQPLWYPVEPLIYPTRLHTQNPQLTTPQIQIPPINQQIFHLHDIPSPSGQDNIYEEQTNYEEHKNEEEYPQIQYVPESTKQVKSKDQMDTAATQMDQKIKIMIAKNESLPIIVSWITNKLDQNITVNEIPEPENLFGKDSSTESNVLTTFDDQSLAESHVEFQIAQATNNRRRQRPQNYDYDYEEDYVSVNQKRKQRPMPASRRTQKPFRPQPTRINSKRGQYRPLTTPDPYYDDEYDITTPRSNRRKPTRTPPRRGITTPSYEFDEYVELQRPNRRKINRNGIRKTTPAYDEYYGNEEGLYEAGEEGDYMFSKQRATIRPRQQQTTTSTESTTDTSTTSTTETTITTASTANVTSGYPYPGNNLNNNVSITYGPPPLQHPGYGPSNGNEQISITYGPSTGSQVGPLLDSWYNQYAKSSVIRRIQDLLTPSNYYSQQYDIDKYNYNDSVF